MKTRHNANTGDMYQSLSRKIPWRRKWHPTLAFLSGKSHGQRSLVGHSPRGRSVGYNLVTEQQEQLSDR